MDVDKKAQTTNGFGSDGEASVAGSSRANVGLDPNWVSAGSRPGTDVQRNGLCSPTMNGEAQDKAGGTAQSVPVKEEPDPWTKEHLFLLLDQMKALLPENDNFRYKTTEHNMDWEKLKIGDFTSQTCRQRWSQLSTKVRKFRTLSELLFDAKEYLKNPYKGMKIQNHPDFPKKPLTPYLRFYLLKRKKFAKIHPQLNNLDLTRMLSQTYKDMPEKKRVKCLTFTSLFYTKSAADNHNNCANYD
uniref:HMG box domain-containing protein n=1 Tax=Eptatretus burgeri TaxID=7764 RepID=A0A8C4NHI2_EPTBU